MDLDFIIPAYNEEKNIGNIVYEIRKYFQGRIIVVDDFSSDATYNNIPNVDSIIKIRNSRNQGKGFSIKRGFNYTEGSLIAFVDGDMKGIIENIYYSLDCIRDYDCLVFSPPIKGGGMGLVRKFAHYVVFKETGLSIPWCISGMRIIRSSAFKSIKDRLEDRFAFEVSMTVELINNNYKVNNIALDFEHRVTGKDIGGYCHRGKQFEDICKYYFKIRK